MCVLASILKSALGSTPAAPLGTWSVLTRGGGLGRLDGSWACAAEPARGTEERPAGDSKGRPPCPCPWWGSVPVGGLERGSECRPRVIEAAAAAAAEGYPEAALAAIRYL